MTFQNNSEFLGEPSCHGATASYQLPCWTDSITRGTIRWRRRLGARAVLCLFAGALLGPASSVAGAEPTLVTRVKFLAAEAFLDHGQIERFEAIADELVDYPLYPYLVERRFRRRLPKATGREFEQARTALSATPLGPRLVRRWLRHLAKNHRWAEYRRLYAPARQTDLKCYYAQALFKLGEIAQATTVAERLWLVGRSQHKTCDPAFEAWRKIGFPYPLVHARLELAINRGSISLVKYLRQYLSAADLRLADIWLELRKRPKNLLRYAQSPISGIGAILESAIKSAAHRDLEQAIAWWKILAAERPMAVERIAPYFGQLLFRRQQHPEAREWLALAAPRRSSKRDREIRVFNTIALGDWESALESIANLPEEEQGSEQWRYWRARVMAERGENGAASAIWRALANERSYYGYLAADRLGSAYRFNERPLRPAPDALSDFERNPAFVRARELWALGRRASFRSEWRHLTRQDASKLAIAAALAHQNGWYSVAILSLAQAGQLDDLAIRFPIMFEPAVQANSERQDISASWILATVRQESAFMPDARSSAGALGLMQILPSTGRALAARHSVASFRRTRLLEPALNIRLGSAYLRELLDEFNHPILASAAYNAGPNRIRRWRPAKSPISVDLWVETIPFRETRKYVKRISYYQVLYARQLGREPTRMKGSLEQVTPRRGRLPSGRPSENSRGEWRAGIVRAGYEPSPPHLGPRGKPPARVGS